MSLGTTPVGEQETSLASELQSARERNWRLFRALLKGRGAERAPDYLLVTAAHEGQTAGCREELEWRQQELGLIPARTQCLALSDPAGQHVGSGGATLLALAEMARRALGRAPRSEADYLEAFRGKRVLLIHSGGDSQRIAHESPLGKAFSPLPGFSPIGGPLGRFRETWTAFDELFVSLSVLLSRMREGLVVASGDVVVLLDAASVSFRSGVMGLACPAPAEVGTRQGVFHLSPEGRLLGYHQKPSIHRMASEGILPREDGSLPVDVDTGIICLDPDGAAGLASLGVEIAFSAGAAEPLDLYRHLLPTLALAPESRRGLPAGWPKRIAAEFGATKLTAHRLKPAAFAHFDTTRGFMSAFRHGMPGLTPDPRPSWYASYRVGQAPESPLVDPLPGGCGDGAQQRPDGGLSVASWSGARGGSEGAGSLMEWCDLREEWSLGEGALACDLRRPGVPVHLRPHVVGHRIPVSLPGPSAGQSLSVLRLYGVADNPKLPAEPANGSGGGCATLFGESLMTWLAERGISAEDVWPGVPRPDRSLWNARLYPAAEPPQDLRLSLWMQEPGPPSPDLLKAWLVSPRVSLEQCFHVVDLVKLRRQRRELQDAIELDSWADLLQTDISSDDLLAVASLQHLAPGGSPLERLLEQSEDPLLRARVCRVLADFRHRLAGIPGAGHRGLAGRERGAAALATLREPKSVLRQKAVELEVQAFRHVSEAIRSVWHLELASLTLEPGESAVAECPARLDFGGGWSDTPPHSLERGGVVLNAAVTLSGRAPILAEVKALRRPELRLTSHDLNKTRVMDSLAEATAYGDPSNPFALHKAALVYVGIVPEKGRTLKQELQRFGGGLEIITASRVPKGSGLGTSSILAAALLRALWEATGVDASQERIFEGVLAIEQMLTTGGGWQDQIGGAVPGIKLIRTEAGIPQRPVCEAVALTPEADAALKSHLVLFYTGQRRLARNILRTVMGGYLARNPDVCRVLREIKEIAVDMRNALETSDLDRFGCLMTRHWELNKLMDPHSSNAHIEALFAAAAPHISGGKLVGAGGGGFMELVLRSPELLAPLKRDLSAAGAHYYEYELDPVGLRVMRG